MNDSYITFQGWIGNDVVVRDVGEVPVATFRVASTPRRYNRQQNGWADGDTTWYTVNAWRMLARNCATSLKAGEAVTVTGKFCSQTWIDAEGKEQVTWVVEAISVGHDLNRGTSAFLKNPQFGGDREPADDSGLRAFNGSLGTTGPQVTSDGQPVEEPQTDEERQGAESAA